MAPTIQRRRLSRDRKMTMCQTTSRCVLIDILSVCRGNTDTGLQFGGSVAEATLPIRMQFIRKVYAIL